MKRDEQGCRLFINNVAWTAVDDDLRALFEGRRLVDVHVVTDRETGRSRGFAFATMATQDDATDAAAALDGAEVRGRAVRVRIAEERRR